ncbi:MAG: hypothetical protein DI556_07635 [Rhodovulum sulfidophilum]|uniref:Uncharacterized protein n=1 Tax=Rhodovulum sulfidophilum TaxID=35806 RepID=A0A2W5ND30_RHOSU|nr:MAG: hypothetical protein DI556_07635 [Rhodovulum sulfidophilum]
MMNIWAHRGGSATPLRVTRGHKPGRPTRGARPWREPARRDRRSGIGVLDRRDRSRTCRSPGRARIAREAHQHEGCIDMKGVLAWLIGIPIPIIILLYLLHVF